VAGSTAVRVQGRRGGRPTIPRPLRKPVAAIGALCAVGLLGLAIGFAGVEGPGALDAGADAAIRGLFGDQQGALRRFVRLGSPAWIPPFLVAIVLVSLVLRRPRVAIANVVGVGITAGAVTVLQPAIGRTLEGGFALPSGHTAGAVAFTAGTSLLVMSLTSRRPLVAGIASAVAVLGVAVIVGMSLVANGLHYTTDTIAGACTAIVAIYGSALAIDRLAESPSRK
jgi:membrane-associated phospholipid phosphatase